MSPARADLELYRMQAEIAKVLGNPVRLRVLNVIGDREVAYGALLDDLGVSKANLSQHLAILRKAGVVSVRRDGVHVYYRLTFPEIRDLCATMRDVLAQHLRANGRQGRRLERQRLWAVAGAAATSPLDCTGLVCPLPVIKLSKAIKAAAPGAVIELLATGPGAVAGPQAVERGA